VSVFSLRLLPRLSTPQVVNKGPITDGGPEEIEFQMSYGKIAGNYIVYSSFYY
jgi:hypothetical protein